MEELDAYEMTPELRHALEETKATMTPETREAIRRMRELVESGFMYRDGQWVSGYIYRDGRWVEREPERP
jgi:hypothetical protein